MLAAFCITKNDDHFSATRQLEGDREPEISKQHACRVKCLASVQLVVLQEYWE